MAGLDGNAQFQTLVFEVLHERHHPARNGPEIVVLQLLILGRLVSHERTAREHQVGPYGPKALIDKEILLLPAQVAEDLLDVLVEIAAHLRGGLVHGRQRAQQGHLVIEGLARVGDEDGRDAERRIDDEGRRRGVPGRVTARLEGIADTAVGERRGVGLLLHEQLAGELLQNTPESVGFGKGIVLLGRAARQGLEPVGVVVGTVLQRPLAHACGNAVGNFARERRTVVHRVEQRRVSLLVEILTHGGASEYLLSEIVRRTTFGSLDLHGVVIYRRINHLEPE